MNDLSAVNAAVGEGRIDEARELLRELLKSPDAETFFAASRVAITDQQKREFLQKAIELDPFHTQAHHTLEALTKQSAPPVTVPPVTVPPVTVPPVTVPPVTVPPARSASLGSFPMTAPEPAIAPPRPRRGIPAGLIVLAAVILLGVVGGGLLLASSNSNGIKSPAFFSPTQTRRSLTQPNMTQTRLAQNARSTTAARNAPALTAAVNSQVTLGQNFLRYYFSKSYRQAGDLSCRSIANAVNAGNYNSMARAFDKMFGADPKVNRAVCKVVNGILQCNVQGTQNYRSFEYELDLRTATENGKMCISSVNLPK